MTETKPTNGLLTDRLNSKDQKTDNLTYNRGIETHQWLMTNFTRVFQPIPLWLNWPITFNGPTLEHHRLTNTIHLALKMTSAQVVEMSVTNNSSFQNYRHPDDHTIRTVEKYVRKCPHSSSTLEVKQLSKQNGCKVSCGKPLNWNISSIEW